MRRSLSKEINRNRIPGSIKYSKRRKSNRFESLESTLHRVLRGRSFNRRISATARPRRQEIVHSYFHRRQLRRSRADLNNVSNLINRARLLTEILENSNQSWNRLRINLSQRNWTSRSDSGLLVINGTSIRTGNRDSVTASDLGTMESQNNSLIWNSRSTDQLESNLSLVVNPPSSLSQAEDSVLSDDSQYTRSSQLDLALEDERRWLKYRIDNLTRDECIITCVLAQMILSCDELPGCREIIPTDEESKQSLLYMSYGGCWELNNLRTVLDLAEFLPVGLRRLCGLGVRDRGPTSRKILEGRLEQCLDLSRRLNLQQAG